MSYNLNPTDKTYPYRRDDTLKDSQASYDPDNDFINVSVPVVSRQIIVETAITKDVLANVDTIFASGDITLNLEDRGDSGIPVSIRNLSGTTTITADVGTPEQTTITFGNAVKFVQIASGDWKAVA